MWSDDVGYDCDCGMVSAGHSGSVAGGVVCECDNVCRQCIVIVFDGFYVRFELFSNFIQVVLDTIKFTSCCRFDIANVSPIVVKMFR